MNTVPASSAPSTATPPVAKPPRTVFIEEIRRFIAARYPLVGIATFEDQRCEVTLREASKSLFQAPMKVYTWTITDGLATETEKVPNTHDPIHAITAAMKETAPSILIFKDLNRHFHDPTLLRKLRDLYQSSKTTFRTLFLISPSLEIPEALSKEIALIDFHLPDASELERLFDTTVKSYKNLQVQLSQDDLNDYVKSALGLTWDEARSAYHRACIGKSVLTRDAIADVLDEKCKIVRKDGILDFIPVDFGIQEIGGLENLKIWLEARARFFTKDAMNFGLSAPKGILLTGISGCGKSSCVKAISQYWRLPLMRLDMTKVYGGMVGNPEETMRRALQTVEAVAPVILWMEEIEKGVAGFTQGDGGVTARIFSSFLTWMQEKKSLVFVAATANEIDKLPPELLRKGRFDEIFFVDLPTEKERLDIFKVHIQKRKHQPEKFNLVNLAKATQGFNGAEIEQVVVGGMYEAFNEKRQFNDQDLYKMIGKTVPLSTTMAEPIKAIKRWADQRAVRASL